MGLKEDFIIPEVGIIGGTGMMGAWLAGLLTRLGSKVYQVGRRTELTPSEIAEKCEVVVISVPIADTIAVIKEIGPLVSEKGLLMDLTSIKKESVEAMMKYSRAEVVGVHPLFGSDKNTGSILNVALCPGRGERGLKWISNVLKNSGFRVTLLSPERHDHLMGLIQGVNHFAALTLALVISRAGFDLDELINCSTQTFRRRLNRIKAIIEQPSELFRSLLMDNSPTVEFLGLYLRSAENMVEIIKRKDQHAFREMFDSLKNFFNEDLHDEFD